MKNQIKTQSGSHRTQIKTSMVLLAAALIAMITPSAATARPPSETPTATLLAAGLEGGSGQHRRPRWRAVRHRRRSRQDLAR